MIPQVNGSLCNKSDRFNNRDLCIAGRNAADFGADIWAIRVKGFNWHEYLLVVLLILVKMCSQFTHFEICKNN